MSDRVYPHNNGAERADEERHLILYVVFDPVKQQYAQPLNVKSGSSPLWTWTSDLSEAARWTSQESAERIARNLREQRSAAQVGRVHASAFEE